MTDMLAPPTSGPRKQPVRADDKLLVSRREAAAQLSISERAVDYLISNKGPHNKTYRYPGLDSSCGSQAIRKRGSP
jgi:hypothetical protein